MGISCGARRRQRHADVSRISSPAYVIALPSAAHLRLHFKLLVGIIRARSKPPHRKDVGTQPPYVPALRTSRPDLEIDKLADIGLVLHPDPMVDDKTLGPRPHGVLAIP